MAPRKSQSGKSQSSDLSQYQGSGLEQVDPSDIQVGRLSIIQALSPELKKKEGAYIAEAEQGMIVNKATKVLFDEIEFLPIKYRKEWQEWAPRKTGTGLVKIHPTEECLLGTEPNEDGTPITPEGNEIIDVIRFFGLNLSTEVPEQCFITFKSTQLKHARQLITFAVTARFPDSKGGTYNPPLWGQTYLLTAREESNQEGSWHNWHIEVNRTTNEWCAEAKLDFEEQVQSILGLQEMAQVTMENAGQKQLAHDTADTEQM